jgi:hypothetical protein
MVKEKKGQKEGGKRIITTILKNIKDGKSDPELAWPGCPRFFPPNP